MGFFVRKAFRAGPVRINLSKSGLGLSAGIKGARIATGPRGSYVFAGRKGLYYRQSLGGKKRKVAKQSADSASIIDFAKILVAIALVIVSISIIRWFFENPTVFFTLAGITVVICGVIFYQKYNTRRMVLKYKTQLENLFIINDSPLNEDQLFEIKDIRSKIAHNQSANKEIASIEKKIYDALLDKILDDKMITNEEKDKINQFDSIINLDEGYKTRAKMEIFRLYYLDIIADREITNDELLTLHSIVSGLSIDQSKVKDEMAIVDEIVRMQKLTLPLNPLEEIPINIQKSEKAFYFGEGTVLSRKKARKKSEVEYEYSVKRRGKLVITDKRVLIVGEGTTSIKLSDILDIDVDLDNSVMIISKSSTSQPVFIQTKEPLYCGRIIDLISM